MVTQEQVIELYKLILDREPESEMVINEKRRSDNLARAAADMLKSDEFFNNNKDVLKVRLK